jgi:hypothetical protein
MKRLQKKQKDHSLQNNPPDIRRAPEKSQRVQQRRALIAKALAGHTDYPLTNEELEALDS